MLIPRAAAADWARHVYREHNKEADALANQAMDDQCSSGWLRGAWNLVPRRLRGYFDGGRRENLTSSCGWLVQACYTEEISQTSWHTVAWGSHLLEGGTTSVDAELTGAELLTQAIHKIVAEVARWRASRSKGALSSERAI